MRSARPPPARHSLPEYGVALHELAVGIRRNVIAAVESMTGLEVTEVNITVFDVMLFEDAESGGSTDPEAKPRVQ
ncbi:Asp23/Gls24 family envelope stress response protein [Streptomyces sp. NPDC050698]